MTFLNRLLAIVIALQVGFAPVLPAIAAERASPAMIEVTVSASSPSAATELNEVTRVVAEAIADPFLAKLQESDFPLEMSVDPTDSALDQDPFFIRAQSWVSSPDAASTADEDGILLAKNNADSVTIGIPGVSKALHINAPIHAVLATDDFILFAANQGSSILSAATPSGQGLFFMSRRSLPAASISGSRIPLMFFPLPGTGWIGNVTATEIAHRDMIVVANTEGLRLPLMQADIQTVANAETVNYTLAVTQTYIAAIRAVGMTPSARSAIASQFQTAASTMVSGRDALTVGAMQSFMILDRQLGANFVAYPARGSTAAFGMAYVGLNLDDPRAAMPRAVTQVKTPLLQRLFDSIIPTAHASGEDMIIRFAVKTGWILARLAGIAIVSIALRYNTLLKKKFDARADQPGPVTATLDTLAHTLTTLMQIPSVWFPNLVEQALDNNLSGVASAENGLIRKVYNYFLGFTRQSNSRTPVDAKTLKYGVLGIGLTDTAVVALQWIFMIPAIIWGVGEIIPYFHGRYEALFDSPTIVTYIVVSILSNFVAWLQAGPTHYPHEVQDIETNLATTRVRNEMRHDGNDPDEARHKDERDRRVNDAVKEAFKKQELPGEEKFLFDAASVYREIQSKFGYEPLPRRYGETPNTEEYLGVSRQGLIRPALTKALQAARKLIEQEPSNQQYQQAYALLTNLQSDISLLARVANETKALFSNPTDAGLAPEPFYRRFARTAREYLTIGKVKEVAQRYKQVRRELVSLTFKGPVNAPFEITVPFGTPQETVSTTATTTGFREAPQVTATLLPDQWIVGYGEGARVAASLYRTAIYGLTGEAPVHPTTLSEAVTAVTPAIQQRGPGIVARVRSYFSHSTVVARANIRYEELMLERGRAEYRLNLEAVSTIVITNPDEQELDHLIEDEYQRAALDPRYQGGAFAKWQVKRAFTRTEQKYAAAFDTYRQSNNPETTPFDTDSSIYGRIARDELLKASGLYPDYTETQLIELVERRAQQEFEKTLDKHVAYHSETNEDGTVITRETTLRDYMASLPSQESSQIEATVRADLFAKHYVEATVKEEFVSALSPAQPGRFQALRQASVRAAQNVGTDIRSRATRAAGRVMSSGPTTRLIRMTEATFVDYQYQRGAWAKVTRELVPVIGDSAFGTKRMIRKLPSSMTAAYLFTMLIWGVDARLALIPALVNTVIAGPTVIAGWVTTMRMIRMQGWKPAASISSMLKYALLGSMLTFGGGLVYMLFDPEISSFVTAAEAGVRDLVGPACADLLTNGHFLTHPPEVPAGN